MSIKEEYPDLLTLDGFDEAILGVVERINLQVFCYDRNKIINILMRDMNLEDAMEYYEYNILGAYMGESTPVYLDYMPLQETKCMEQSDHEDC
jgi:hypothetical protein